ncbi:MAG: hypothetical protein OEZ36_11130, partial [Spirochaetota bacterium]|nr:hypothetical protein [Spirochaetota bacterium]
SLREMASGWMKAGRTEYFSQNTDGVFFLSNKKDKDGKKIPGNDIEEFVALSSGSKSHNKTFFNEAFSLQNGGLSSKVLVEEMQGKFLGRKVYFIIKKVGEKLPDLKGLNVLETKTLMGKIRQADYLVIEALWLNYLQKEMGFSVEINKKSIFQELGIPVPKEPESPEKTAS